MKYIIMAGGPATRWHNYHNTTKHLIKVNNETLLERLVRQLKQNNVDDISITTKNPNYKISGVALNEMIYENKVYNMFYYKFLNTELTFLYGDTFYSDEVIEQIVNCQDDDIMFFGTKESVIGIRVVNFKKFKKYVRIMKEYNGGRVGWAIYRKINNLDDNNINFSNFSLIDSPIFNINSPDDYEKLMIFLNERKGKIL